MSDGREFIPGHAVVDGTGRKVGTLVGAAGGTVTVQTGRIARREVVVPEEALRPAADGYELLGELDTFEREPAVPLGEQELAIALHEEALIAEKYPVVRGHLRVKKRIVTEKRTLTVEVRREELRIDREPASARDAPVEGAHAVLGAPLVEHEGWLPLYEEEVEIAKRPRVREWIRIRKVVEATPRTYAARVQRETADVDADRDVAPDVVAGGGADVTH